jgi:drug/metabolite transporter (DMT)-like permease
MSNDGAGDSAALAAGLVTVGAWGSAFVAIRSAGDSFSPGALALGRLLVSCVLLGAVALWHRRRLPGGRDLAAIALYGVLWLGLYSTALNAGERHVDAGTAAMVVNTGPILIAVLAGLVLDEGFPGGLFAGCAVAFAGCLLIGLATTGSGGGDAGLGIALCVLAAVAYAVAVVVQKPVLARVSPFQVTFVGCVSATLALLPFAPALGHEAGRADTAALFWVVYLGVVPTALGFATWTFALRRTSAGRMASLAYLIPVVAIGLGWALLDERPPALAAAGGVLCLAGVWLARRRPLTPRAARRPAPRRGGRAA